MKANDQKDISGTTELICLLGKPARHSLSPLIHNEGFRQIEADYRYLAFEPENLEVAVRGLQALGARGWNLTMPYKKEIIPLLDELDEEAALCQSVNTVVNEGGYLKGYTTDGRGFLEAVRAEGTEPEGKRFVVLGTGAAAASIVTAIVLCPDTRVIVFGRPGNSMEEMFELAKRLDSDRLVLGSILDAELVTQAIRDADVLVQTTPVGMKTRESVWTDFPALRPETLVVDIIYEPRETLLLEEARLRGCRTFNGLEMLLQQAKSAFELWTGKSFDVDIVRQKMEEAESNRSLR